MKDILKRLFAPSAGKTDLGRAGEKEAERFLKKKGYRIVERNYRTRHGEIDIVALDGDTLVFVEVKTRLSHGFGIPQDSVDRRKMAHIIKASKYYITENPTLKDHNVRFDVVGITIDKEGLKFEHIPHAFEVEE